MRENYLNLTSKVRKALSLFELEKSEINTIITVELFLTVFKVIAPDKSASEAWAIIPGYNYPIIPKEKLDQIVRLRILFSNYRNSKGWNELLNNYREIPQKFRCFEILNNGNYEYINPKVVKERITTYQEILSNPIERIKSDKILGRFGDFKYVTWLDKERKELTGNIPEELLSELVNHLLPYRDKKIIRVTNHTELFRVAQELDEMDTNGNWSGRIKNFNLKFFNNQEIGYKDNIHIAGSLGAGKSTFMLLETYRLVKEEKAKVGFIELNVEQVLKRVSQLRSFGIKAVPIIGQSTRDHHLERYLLSHFQQVDNITDWSEKEHEVLKYLSGKCILKALAQDFGEDTIKYNEYPCERVMQGKDKCLCPLLNKCGVHKATIELVDADVWVSTVPALLNTRIPAQVDPYKRTYYEAMYDLLDVIFIDEADKIQQNFEQAYVSEHDLFGNNTYIFENLLQQSAQYIDNDYTNFSNSLVTNWQLHLHSLKPLINKIYYLLPKLKTLNNYLKNDIFHIYRVLNDLCRRLFNSDDYTKTRGYKLLKEYINSPLEDSPFVSIVDRLLRDNSKRILILNEALNLIEIDLKILKNHETIYQLLEFFLYLARIDFHFRYLLQNYLHISSYIGFTPSQANIFQKSSSDLKPFMLDSMTGMLLGYKYFIGDGQDIGSFKLVEYNGVGRQLLQDWHKLYEVADNKKGPAVVFLSGTSYSPGSSHFNLNIPVSILLESTKTSPNVDIFFTPVFDQQNNGEAINISGIFPREYRNSKIKKIIVGIKDKIEEELDYWRDANRKVLLVVNSYEDTDVIADIFKDDPIWGNRFKSLQRIEEYDYHFPTALVESFSSTDCDILAVPLSAIGRGFNILSNQNDKSYFGSVFFLIRPYTVPGDMQNKIQILHDQLPIILNDIFLEKLQYEEGIKKLRNSSIGMLETMVRKPEYWSILSPKEREVLSWYTFVMSWQMIGRLLRGNSDARVFFVDAKFSPERAKGNEDNETTSLLESWRKIMNRHRDDEIFQALYGPFIKGINNLC